MFRTYEPTRDRLVAVKVFRLDVIPEQAQALADELSRAADAGLFHPSIVEPIAAGVEGTVAYRAEEYVAAESLDVAMRHYAPAPLDRALPFITQLAGAIDFARAAGVGHGALHPRDIFVTPDEARATGFGVVEALERVGLRAPVRRPYSAPERITGEAWGTPADVFSLAAIAYELLTSKRPSGTGEHIGTLDGSRAGTSAAAFHAVLARAMDEDPAKRYPAALAFAAALEAAASAEVSSAIAAPPPEPIVGPPIIAEPPERREPQKPPGHPEPLEPPEPASPLADILVERDEDEAHHALAQEEAAVLAEPLDTAGGAPEQFDEEAAADLAFAEAHPEPFADDFSTAGEPTSSRDESGELLALDDEVRDAEPAAFELASEQDSRALAPVEEEAREDRRAAAAATYPTAATVFGRTILEERPRSAALPVAIALVVGLLIGFAAGYAIGGRNGPVSSELPAAATAQPPGPAAKPSGQAGKAWSEQQVGRQGPQEAATPRAPAEAPAAAPPGSRPGGAPPAVPTAPAVTRGTLVVRSTPPGASVTVNGTWRGRTPLTLENLRFGPYSVRIVQSGYAVEQQEVRLSKEEPAGTVTVRLRRSSAPPQPAQAEPSAARGSAGAAAQVGAIYVDSRPRGARVFIDGRDVGVTPLRIGDVQAGSHRIRLELADHRTWTDNRNVPAGQETRVTGSLERIR